MPLGEGVAGSASVEVSADLRRLFDGFKEAENATRRWDRSMAQNATRSTKELQKNTDALGKSFYSLSGGFRDAGRSAMNYTRDVQKAGDQTARAVSSTENSLAGLRRTFIASAGVIAGALGAREIVQLADSYTSFTNKLRSAGLEGQNLARTQQDLFEIAQRYGTELGTLGALYGRISQAQNDLGVSGGQIAQATEGAAAALRLYGAGQAEANGALIQFSQMLGNAMPQMQEFNSINDGARPILQAVANGLDEAGGSISKLRQLILDQKITTKEFFDAYLRGIPQVIAEAEKMPLTIGASLQRLNNALGKYIGETDKSLNATQRISQAIGAMADNLDTVMPIITGLAIALGTKYVAAATAKTIATIRDTAATVRATLAAEAMAAAEARNAGLLLNTSNAANIAAASVTRLAVAQGTAAKAGSALIALMGGPWMAAITALGLGIYALTKYTQGSEEATGVFAKTLEDAKIVSEDATKAIDKLADAHGKAREEALAAARAEAENVKQKLASAQASVTLAKAELARAKSLQQAQNTAAMSAGGTAPGATAGMMRMTGQRGVNTAQVNLSAAEAGVKELEDSLSALNAAIGRSQFEPTQGRNLAAEIDDLRQQLLAANKTGNETAQREILAQIKLREKVTRYMKDGLSFEIAMATAQAEGLGAAKKASETMKFTAEMAEDALNDIGAKITGRGRPTWIREEQPGGPMSQERLRQRYEAGQGPLAAKPGEGRHEFRNGANAFDIAKGPGITLDKIVKALEARGAKIVEKLDEGSHYHVAWAKSAKNQAQVADAMERAEDAALRNEERFQSELAQINEDILRAKEDQSDNPDMAAGIAMQRINNERDRFAEEVKNRVGLEQLNAIQAAELTLANERLRTEQLRTVGIEEARRQQQESIETAGTLLDAEVDLLNIALGMTTNEEERRDIQLKIIDAEQRIAALKLAEVLATEKSAAARERAQIEYQVAIMDAAAKKQDVLDAPYAEFADGFANALGRATESVLALENPLSILRNFLMDLTSMFNEQFIVNPIKEWGKEQLGMPLAKEVIGEASPIDPAAIKTAGTLQVLDLAAANAAKALAMMAASGGGGGGGFLGSLLSIAGSTVGGGGLNLDTGPIQGIDASGAIGGIPKLFHEGGEIGPGGTPLRRRKPGEVDIRAKVGEFVVPPGPARQFRSQLDMMRVGKTPSFGGIDNKGGLIGAMMKSGLFGGFGERGSTVNFGNIVINGVSDERTGRAVARQISSHLRTEMANAAKKGYVQ